VCDCAVGYKGAACSTIATTPLLPCIDSDINVKSECPTYTGSALEVKTARAANTAFKFFDGVSNGVTLFDIKGNGLFTTYQTGLFIVGGGETIVAGGMRVKVVGTTIADTGMHVTDGGATIKYSATNSPVVTATSTSAGSSFSGSSMVVKSTRAANTAFNYIKAISDSENGGGTTVFSVVGDGKMRVHTGGLLVSLGGGTIDAGGLKVTDGVTIHTGGLNVVSGGATVTAGGLKVVDGGTTIIDTSSASADVVAAHVSHASYTGTVGVLHVKSTRAGNSAFKLLEAKSNDDTSVFSVNGLGKTTVLGGLKINTIGTTVTTSGLQAYAGETVVTGGLQVVVSGVTTSAGGLTVVSGGSSIITNDASLSPLIIQSTATDMTMAVLCAKCSRTSDLHTALLFEFVANSAVLFTVDGNGDIVTESTVASTVSSSGSVRTAGGLGVALGIYTGGIVKVESSVDSTSSVTGSLTVAGGVGIAKDVYVGGLLVATSGTSVQPHSITGDTTVKTHSSASATETATFTLQRARGSESSATAVHVNDVLGVLSFQGYDGSAYKSGASIKGINENAGSPVSSDHAGGKLLFQTSASNAVTPLDAMQIDMAGQLKVLSTTESTSSATGSLLATGGLGIAKSLYVGEKLVSIVDDDQTKAITDSLVMTHDLGTNLAGNNVGTTLAICLENSNREVIKSAQLEFLMTTATVDSENCKFNVNTIQSGTLATRMHITGAGTSSIVTVTPTTASTSTTTGSLLLKGGMGIGKSIYSTGQLNINRETTSTNSVLDLLVLEHTKSDGGPAQNMGTDMVVALESADGNLNKVGSLGFTVSSSALGEDTRSGDFILKTAQSNSLFTALQVSRDRLLVGSTVDSASITTGALRINGGMAVASQMYVGGQIYSIVDDMANTKVTNVVSLTHTTSGTVANNIGTGIEIDIETSTALTKAASIDAVMTDKVNGAEDSKILISLLQGGSETLSVTMTGTTTTFANNLRVVGNSNLNGHVTFGNLASADETTVHATLLNTHSGEATAITFEGPVANDFELLLGVDDPTATRSVELPDVTGNIISTGNLADITDCGTLEALIVSGATSANGNTILGSDTSDTITFGGVIAGQDVFSIQRSGQLITMRVDEPSADRTLTLPDATGTVITTGNLHLITSTNTLTSLTVTGATSVTGSAMTIGANANQVVTVKGSVSTTAGHGGHMIFEGSTANNFETKLTVVASVSGEQTLELPDVTGTIVTSGNFAQITQLPSMTALTVSGTSSLTSTTQLGDAAADSIVIDQIIVGASPFVFEGGTSNTKTTTLAIDTLAGDKTVTLPDASGDIITTGNLASITSTGTLTGLTVTGAVSMEGSVTYGNSAANDKVTINGKIQGTSSVFKFNRGARVLNLGLVGPTADRTITLPDVTGTIITTENMNSKVTVTNTLTELTVDGATALNGDVTIGSSSTTLTITAPILPHSSNNYITFEGSTAASQVTYLAAVATSTDKTITLPNTGGTIITDGNTNDLTDLPSLTTLTVSGTVSVTGDLNLGNAEADTTTIKSRILLATPFKFKRASSDAKKTSLTFESASSACKVVWPATTGTILTNGNPTAAASIGTIASSSALTVSGTSTFQGNVVLGDATSDRLTITGRIKGPLLFEGSSSNNAVTTLTLVEPNNGVNEMVLPADASGNVITTGNLADILETGTLDSMSVTGDGVFNGASSFGASTTFTGTIQNAAALRFTIPSSSSLYNIAIVDPTQDRTITIPNVDGTVITTDSLDLIVGSGTLSSLTVTNGLTMSSAYSPTIATKGSATGNSVTINQVAGTITTATLTTAASACTTITLSNSYLSNSATILVTIRGYSAYGSNAWTGASGIPRVIVDTTGTATTRSIKVCNHHTSNALNGVVKIDFILMSL